MPKIKYSLNFHHFYRLDFSTIKLVLCCVLNSVRTSSPLTSCYRLGPCLSTATRSWRSWSLPALKNRPSVTSTWTKMKFHYQSPTNKDKIYLKQDLKLTTTGCVQRYKNCSGWPRDDPAFRRYWTRGWPVTVRPCGATKTILVIERRCLDIRAEPKFRTKCRRTKK